jgi:hypothetical protein
LIVGAIPKAAEYLKTYSSWLGGIAFLITLVSALFLFCTQSDFSGCAYYFGDETSWTDYPPKCRNLRKFPFGKASRRFIIWRERSAKDVTVEQTPTPAASGSTTNTGEKSTAT